MCSTTPIQSGKNLPLKRQLVCRKVTSTHSMHSITSVSATQRPICMPYCLTATVVSAGLRLSHPSYDNTCWCSFACSVTQQLHSSAAVAGEVPRDKPQAWVGRNCRIFWPDDEEWYEAAVRAYDDRIGRHNVWYFYDEAVSRLCYHARIHTLHTAWNHSPVTHKL